ncbi:hypothetical protein KHAB170019_09450 [Acinetobacter baumannii]|nr:hypothetical protein KHAB170019_09450 [Acinetobacter baumannii]BDE20352.1 hypothetical protein OCUAc19_26420 [Acinetobacter baumannii]BDT82910.1 hypothetical protein VNAB260_27610 [Acinetobacter baumannii]
MSKYVQVNPYSYVQQDRKKEIKSCYTRDKQFTLKDRYLKQPAYSAKGLINNELQSILVEF